MSIYTMTLKFTEFLQICDDRLVEGVMPYTKKGKMFVLKQPFDIGGGKEILARGRDGNGNAVIRVRHGKDTKTKQIGAEITITIDDIVGGLNSRQIDHIQKLFS